MAQAYYASSITKRLAKTPEGFLIAKDVPINRVGVQQYLGQELNLADRYNELINVYREPEDVFDDAALASFEGKPTTDDHPPEDVTPNNVGVYLKGHLQNVRRGSGVEDIYTLADIIIADANTISKVENGKREVSCGYHYDMIPYKDGFKQTNIRGNHLAIVEKGRAGSKVSIRDSEIPNKGEKKVTTTRKGILSKMLAAFAKDAEPEDIEKAIDAIAEKAEQPRESKDAEKEKAAEDHKAKDEEIKKLSEDCKAKDLEIEKLKKDAEDKKTNDAESDELEDLEKELEEKDPASVKPATDKKSKDADEERINEKKRIDDEINFLEPNEVPVSKAEHRPKNPLTDASIARNIILGSIQDMKPVIAAIKDPVERKRVTDSLVKSYRSQLGRTENYAKDSYADIQKAVNDKVQKANDVAAANTREAMFADDRGKKLAQQYNPHYQVKK